MKIALHIPSRIAAGFDPPPEGIEIQHLKHTVYLDAEGFSTLNLVVTIGSGVPVSILAAWLYDTFIKQKECGQKERHIKINETVLTRKTKDDIIEVVKREIEYDDK